MKLVAISEMDSFVSISAISGYLRKNSLVLISAIRG